MDELLDENSKPQDENVNKSNEAETHDDKDKEYVDSTLPNELTEAQNEDESSEASIGSETEKKEQSSHEYDSVLSAICNLSEKVDQLNKLFDAKIMHTTHEEKIVDQMHAELNRYKEDMYAQLVRPILLDMIEMRDSIMRVSQTFSIKPQEEQVIPLKTFSGYAYDVQDILEKNNIAIYKSKEGDDFTPIKQRVVKKIPTPVEELHGKIAESLSDGYEYMGKTISPEKITVYVFEAPVDKEGE